jgi:hypothetical protein
VPGNHEYYTFENIPKSNINILVRRLRTLEKVIPNFNPLSLFNGIKKTYNNINLEF